MLDHWFANPWALLLLAALPVLAGFAALAWHQRRRALALLGTFPALHRGSRQGGRIWRGVFWTLGLVLLVLGIAGPQWGLRALRAEDLATGRDLVIVLDLSRSMLAEQPSRQERALEALRDLAGALQAQGGHRVALVVFAAHARLVFPLTTDYDHFRDALAQQDADNLPPSLRPQKGETMASGTRIGEALRTAVAAHDPNSQGAQDIFLVSDGDDPAGDDEWAAGAEAAHGRGIPVYTIGFGDPETASPIPMRSGALKHNGRIVMTRLEERPLQEIARRTQGIYLAARTGAVSLGEWLRGVLEARTARRGSDVLGAQTLPLYRLRYPWFFGAALGCFTISLFTGGWSFRKVAAANGPASGQVKGQQ